MKNFELNDYDVKRIIKKKSFSTKYNIRYREALFMRYLNESKHITLEQIAMLENKYNLSSSNAITNLLINTDAFKEGSKEYRLFSDYIKNIKFDEYSMFEIILAAKAYYQSSNKYLVYDEEMVKDLYKTFFNEENQSKAQLKHKLSDCEDYYYEVLKNHENLGFVTYKDDEYVHI